MSGAVDQQALRHRAVGVIPPRVSAYKVTYATTGVDGEATQATGVLALPSDAAGELTAVSYFHGTGSHKPEVASSWRDPYNTAPAVLLAATGFAAVLPDYLGLGDSPGSHPWMHVASETSAAADMLTASRQAAAELGTPLRPRTHVIGFSQGASVALATSRALQEGNVPGSTRGRTFAISGAYDLRGSELPALGGAGCCRCTKWPTRPTCSLPGTGSGRSTTGRPSCSASRTQTGSSASSTAPLLAGACWRPCPTRWRSCSRPLASDSSRTRRRRCGPACDRPTRCAAGRPADASTCS